MVCLYIMQFISIMLIFYGQINKGTFNYKRLPFAHLLIRMLIANRIQIIINDVNWIRQCFLWTALYDLSIRSLLVPNEHWCFSLHDLLPLFHLSILQKMPTYHCNVAIGCCGFADNLQLVLFLFVWFCFFLQHQFANYEGFIFLRKCRM